MMVYQILLLNKMLYIVSSRSTCYIFVVQLMSQASSNMQFRKHYNYLGNTLIQSLHNASICYQTSFGMTWLGQTASSYEFRPDAVLFLLRPGLACLFIMSPLRNSVAVETLPRCGVFAALLR